ncbi:LysR family transcriptional regulator [Streptomyces sp. NPDC017524]|uniref:LysR family transcriptional regulator n=1 Tax=Streptomyces sp. NPDC017524 TaxID=3364999 RepID=UPI0037BBDDEE
MPPPDIDPRLLRAFLAVADELHFTRAAARLFVAQQALSRDIRRLERELGAELFVRTTRQVGLTPEGERLLPYARQVLDAHAELVGAFSGAPARPLLVDLNSDGATAARVLERARELLPECELMARFESGLTWAAGEILAGRLDASFGRAAGLAPAVRGLSVHPVRYEPMALMLPVSHPLAAREAVTLAELAGETVYAGAGNERTREWTDLATLLFAEWGVTMAPPVPLAVGVAEFQRVMSKGGHPVLAVVDFPALPGTVLRPLVDPVPLSPLALVWRKGLNHPGVDALRSAADQLALAEGWMIRPPGSWLPEGDRSLMRNHS